MKYSKRKDKYDSNVLNDNFREIDSRLKNVEENGGGGTGKDGVSVVSVEQTTTSTEDGGINVITCTLSDGKTSEFEIRNGNKGDSVEVEERFTVSRLTDVPGEWYNVGGEDTKIVFGNGLFVDINGRYSYDGKTWFESDLPLYNTTHNNHEFIEFGNGRFIIIKPLNNSTCGIWYSVNGINWTEADSTLDGVVGSPMIIHNSNYSVYSFAYTKGMFILVYHEFSYHPELSQKFRSYVSSDGINWETGTEYTINITTSSTATSVSFADLVFSNFVAFNGIAAFTGYTHVVYYDANSQFVTEKVYLSYYTSNGKTWSKSSFNKAVSHAMSGNGKYVFIGEDTDIIYHSTDAKSWTTVSTYKVGDVSGTTFTEQGHYIESCTCLNDKYYIITSKDNELYIWMSINITAWTLDHDLPSVIPHTVFNQNLIYGNRVHRLGTYIVHNEVSTDSIYLDSLGGKLGANTSVDYNPLSFIPFSDVSVIKGSLTVETTSDPATFIPLEFDSMYLLLTTEVTISTGVQYGRHVQSIHTSVSPTTGIGVMGRDAIKSTTNSGVSITSIVREDAFGLSLKPSGVAYRVDYALIKIY